MDLPATVALAKASMDVLKGVLDADKALDQATLKARLAGVIGDLADVRIALADASEELRAKDSEIAKLKANFEIRADLLEWHAFKYRRAKTDSTKPLGFPICPRCETVEGLVIFTVNAGVGRAAMCPQCKQQYQVSYQQEPMAPTA